MFYRSSSYNKSMKKEEEKNLHFLLVCVWCLKYNLLCAACRREICHKVEITKSLAKDYIIGPSVILEQAHYKYGYISGQYLKYSIPYQIEF